MVSWVSVLLFGLAGLLSQSTQTPKTGSFLPSVSISLPPDVLSETVQISYFLVGPFGGYGGYAAQRSGMHSYEIPAVVEGKAATEIRMIIYAPGCEIQKFVIPLAEDSRVTQEFACEPVETVRLSGKIVPTAMVSGNNGELVVTYLAYWAHGFYGYGDGFVTRFHLATVSPDPDGMFEVDLPYFSDDVDAPSSQLTASFQLMLRDSKTWNAIVFNLEPEVPDFRSEDHCLRIRSYYPDRLNFVPTRATSHSQRQTVPLGFRRRDFQLGTSCSPVKGMMRIILRPKPMENANIYWEPFRQEIIRWPSMPGFQEEIKLSCQNPLKQKLILGEANLSGLRTNQAQQLKSGHWSACDCHYTQ